jgi:hypothetical protein
VVNLPQDAHSSCIQNTPSEDRGWAGLITDFLINVSSTLADFRSGGQRGIETACGVEAAGAEVTQSSELAVKQEIFGVTQRISNPTVRLVG